MLCSKLVLLNLQITNNVQFYSILLQEILYFTTNHFAITCNYISFMIFFTTINHLFKKCDYVAITL